MPGASAFGPFLFLFAALQGLVFSFVLLRYDLLTTALAIFTVETWLLLYPLYCIFHRIDALNSSLAMLPWFLLLLFGLTLYFRPQIVVAYHRVKEVLE